MSKKQGISGFEENAKLARGLALTAAIIPILLASGKAPLYIIFLVAIISEWKKQKKFRPWFIILGVEIIVFMAIIAFSAMTTNSPTNTSSVLDQSTSTKYTSSEYGFKINFPGLPSSERSSIDVEGISVPYTQYIKDIDNGQKIYTVQVMEYPISEFNLSGKERSSLDGSINGMVKNNNATIISLSNTGTFLSYPSAEAKIKYISDKSYDIYTLNFIKGNYLYTITTIGENKATFDAFISSFKFI